MPDAVLHPTPQELTAFGLGKLPEHAAAVVAAHLEKCPPCRQAVADVLPDSFLDKVRAAGPAGSSSPPSLAQPNSVPNSASRPAIPVVACPDVPPELARHPKFLILRELGCGGMGVVYQARHKDMNRQVVIKVINRSLLDRPDSLERFHREIQAAAKLSHPNIVTAYDAERASDLHMLVMEFVPGQSLAEILEKRGPLPVVYSCHYMRQVALGLQHAHERNMVHRDIKPSNLMLSLKNQIKILDFGLAKVISERGAGKGLTESGAYMGTPDYCAPEQALDAAQADIRADLYSLGCTLYCLLAGHPPFHEDTVMKTYLAHREKQPQPLPELRPEVSAELWQVVKRLLAKDPAHRYQKPIEVFRALSVFVKSGAKAEAKSGSTPAQKDVAPDEGTKIAADASAMKMILREVPGKLPPKPVPAKDEVSPFADLLTVLAPPRKTKGESESTKRTPMAWSRFWPLLAGAGLLLLVLLGMWAFTGNPPNKIEEPERKAVEPPSSITNSIDMELVLVKPGIFLMGSLATDKDHFKDEEQHEVEITRSFYVGRFEVTQGQYERIMHDNPSFFSSTGEGRERVQDKNTRRFPVENVSWFDAKAFCDKLSEWPDEKAKGRAYRLPTEAEWEYCCRGGHLFKKPPQTFHFGNSLSSTQANFDGSFPYGGEPEGPFHNRTIEVGSYRPPNHPLGLYDFHGNVREWCADWYAPDYYHLRPQKNPQGPKTGKDRVFRGGSWDSDGSLCRTALRNSCLPDVRSLNLGFRVIFDVGAKK